MAARQRGRSRRAPPADSNFFSDVLFKIDYANALCAEAEDPATLARISLRAIFNKRMELAKAYERDLEEPDFRDVRLGYDPNEILKKELLRDILDRMSNDGLLSQRAILLGPPGEMVDKLTRKKQGPYEKDGALASSLLMDLTEYGRVVHAEMCAICDAARLGRNVKGATLFCTTFPCHNCTKHILAAGIKRVVYMEPYPKSRAKDLHQNEIEIEKTTPGRVSFVPFLGISPFRYRDIFQKGKRKDVDGNARRWLAGTERPMIDPIGPDYFDLEKNEIAPLLGEAQQDNSESNVPQNST